MTRYAELHCHSNYSFHEGASHVEELVLRAHELGYAALALTDHDNLCGAMAFAQTAKAFDVKPLIGCEMTLDVPSPHPDPLPEGEGNPHPPLGKGGRRGVAPNHSEPGTHVTLIAATLRGYNQLCRLLSRAHVEGDRRRPHIPVELLAEHSEGLILLSGCRQGEIPRLAAEGHLEGARRRARQYLEWFGPERFYLELQDNLVRGDGSRNARLAALGRELGIGLVATNNVHYHVRERHRLQDALVAIQHGKSLDETHRERRPNSEFFLQPPEAMARRFRDYPEAIASTLRIAEACSFDLTRDLNYQFPSYPMPEGHSPDSYLEELCLQAARRRYGTSPGPSLARRGMEIPLRVQERLAEEMRLIRRHGLAGFFLIYHDLMKLAKEVAVDLGVSSPATALEEEPAGRGRGSSVSMLVGYLIGLSHIDPLQYGLRVERFLQEELTTPPDIDVDFPRNIREELIVRIHRDWGWEHAALTAMFPTYQIRGAIRDLGKALGLPPDQVDHLAKRVDGHSARVGATGRSPLQAQMAGLPEFRDKVTSPGWRDLIELAAELDGFPQGISQHPGGMIVSSTPIAELVPVQPGAMAGRYICQWDKDSIDDAGFVKLDLLALGALSQLQEAVRLVEAQRGYRLDLSRIDFHDPEVYELLGRGDTVGVFQVESEAQMGAIVRTRPRSLEDLAAQVALVRPGVGVNHSMHTYVRRRRGEEPVTYDHPLEERALGRTLGAILFQDQVIELAMGVAGFSAAQGDRLRRAYGRKKGRETLLQAFWEQFRQGAAQRGVPEAVAQRIFGKFNGEYMFPEAHAYAFGVTAYQATYLKRYEPLTFYTALLNQQPMGFWNPETIKEDAKRHGIAFLHPDVNRSEALCTIEGEAIRLGLLLVQGVGEAAARMIVERRRAEVVGAGQALPLPAGRSKQRPYGSVGDLLARTGLSLRAAQSLIDAGALDGVPSSGFRVPSSESQDAADQAQRSAGARPPPGQGVETGLQTCPPATRAQENRPEGLFLRRREEERTGGGRRQASWELGLHVRPVAGQLPLGLPVDQDLVALPAETPWERMLAEYGTLGLHPDGQVIAYLRPQLGEGVLASLHLARLAEGARVKLAGLVVSRQRPGSAHGVVFMALLDEYGLTPVIVWPDRFRRYRLAIKEPLLLVEGRVTHRDGTLSVVAERIAPLAGPGAGGEAFAAPRAKNWG